MTTHLMIDIETLGTRSGAIVMSVALVRFSDEAAVSLNLAVHEQQALGLEIDPGTSAFWAEQAAANPATWTAATHNPLPLATALPYIDSWIHWAAGGDDWLVWCHGATFDCPLLDEVYRRFGLPSPWKFWQVRDTRTLYDLAGVNVKDYPVPPPHIALNDAIGQTRAAVAALGVVAGVRGIAA
jgi:hypothetical protein